MNGKSVLIVDDEPDICSELGGFLSKQGYTVTVAPNGKEALQLFKKIKPDIVISDYRMPVMSGFELFLKIKGIDPGAKVILISAVVDLDAFVLTKNSSAFEFLEKPIDLTRLLELMKKQ